MAQNTAQISPPLEFIGKVDILARDFENLNPKLQSPIVPRDMSMRLLPILAISTSIPAALFTMLGSKL